jgi:quercetin dioxygenase-like cupin family protein
LGHYTDARFESRLETPVKEPLADHGSRQPGAHQRGQEEFRVIRSEEVQWRAFAAFPPQARLAVLVGEPTRPGPYLIRVKLPGGTRMMPHRHPEDRIYTVISGIFYIGIGSKFDETALTAHAPGSVVVLPGGQSHFHWAKSGEYITQVTALGPLDLEYVDRAHDPRAWDLTSPQPGTMPG